MTDWDYERSRWWFPGSSEAAPAPAEERETPVEEEYTAEQTAEQWALFRKWLDARPNVAVEVRALLLRESAALPAEDRAVTLCEKCDGSGFVHDADGMEDNCDCGALNARMKADQQRGEDRAVTAPQEPETLIHADVQLLAWAVSNCHTLARRELNRVRPHVNPDTLAIERWEHVLRVCEKAGARSAGVLRASVPTEITEG